MVGNTAPELYRYHPRIHNSLCSVSLYAASMLLWMKSMHKKFVADLIRQMA